jgi:hypothetical protein
MLDSTSAKSAVTQPEAFDLDGLYGPEEIAHWMRLSKRTILALARLKKIPVVRLNERVLRFHPRTILAKQGLKVS